MTFFARFAQALARISLPRGSGRDLLEYLSLRMTVLGVLQSSQMRWREASAMRRSRCANRASAADAGRRVVDELFQRKSRFAVVHLLRRVLHAPRARGLDGSCKP